MPPHWSVVPEEVPDAPGTSAFFLASNDGAQRLRIGSAPAPGSRGYVADGNGGVTSTDLLTRQWLASNVEYRLGDVVVCTYPKCGTTLTEQIVLLLLNGGDAAALDPLSKNATNSTGKFGKVWPEVCVRPDAECTGERGGPEEFVKMTLADFDGLPAPRVIKTHARARDLLGVRRPVPPEDPPTRSAVLADGAKYIVAARNPYDAVASAFYHAWNPHRSGWPFAAWVEAWLLADAHSGCGGWASWLRGWHDVAQSPEGRGRVLWIHYEEMLKNPEAEVRRVAAFIGIAVDEDDGLIRRVVEGSSFGAMKAAAEAAAAKGGRSNTAGHLRKGKRGNGLEHFDGCGPTESARLRELVRAAFHEGLDGTGLTFECSHGVTLEATR